MRVIFLIFFIFLTGCVQRSYYSEVLPSNEKDATKRPYVVNGKIYYPLKRVYVGWKQRGIASWYGPNFHGKYTSNGEVYNMYAFTAAHKTLPMNTIVRVKNLNNGKSVVVRINDRGPFVRGRIIDLSYAAGKKIGLDKTGTAPVVIEVIGFKGKNYVSGFMVQVGAFINKEGAKRVARRYRKMGYKAKVIKQGRLYKVYIVGFKNYNEAKRFMIRNNIAGFIVGE